MATGTLAGICQAATMVLAQNVERTVHKTKSRGWVRWIAVPVLAAFVLAGGYLGGLQLTGNYHAVLPGVLYRSAQPSAADIADHVGQDGIRTILNLRGSQPGVAWYDAETAEAQKLGIEHVDFSMSAHRELSRAEAKRLVALMKDAPKPLLIHCKAGSDRTGLAAALYLAAISKSGEADSEGQISLFYGHVSLSVSPSFAMDRTFENLEPWLGYKHS